MGARRIGWIARRLAISIFVVFHLGAVAIWNLPESALQQALLGITPYYMLPTGLWQNWAMFAPEPVRDTVAFEAVIQDRSGMLRNVPFPRTAELSVIEAIPKYRHAKFTAMIGAKESTAAREFTARHVARTAGLPDDAFPVTVQLYYQYWPSNPPGQGAMDPLAVEPRIKVLETYRFASLEDCQP